jgi:hypothetical protein
MSLIVSSITLAFGFVLPWFIVGLGCWLGYQLLRQNGRMLLHLEALEQRLAQLSLAPSAAPAPTPGPPSGQGIADRAQRKKLIALARRFAAMGDKALEYKGGIEAPEMNPRYSGDCKSKEHIRRKDHEQTKDECVVVHWDSSSRSPRRCMGDHPARIRPCGRPHHRQRYRLSQWYAGNRERETSV